MTDMPDLSFSAVCKGQYQAGYEAGYLNATKDFGSAMRKLQGLHLRPGGEPSSDRQYLEKIADQVIANNHSKANTHRQTSPVDETVSAQCGADASKVVCPALIDDVGGQ